MKKTLMSVVLIAFGSATAAAQPPVYVDAPRASHEFRTERVAFADLDISSMAGVDALQARIRQAADRVCATTNPELLAGKLEEMGCRRNAVADGFAQIERFVAAGKSGSTVLAAITISAR